MQTNSLSDPDHTKVIAPKERILLIDSLRGYALMGLFLVHMVEYYELFWYHPSDSVYKDIVFAFFGGKAYAMFALLFGVSFFIIFNSKKNSTGSFSKLVAWRFCLLLAAGILHGMVYGGDILQVLALAGFFFIPLHRAPDYILLILAACFLLQLPAVLYAWNYIVQQQTNYAQPLHWTLFTDVYEIYAHGSLPELLAINLSKAPVAKWSFMLESGRISTIVGMTFLGYWLGKTSFFNKGPQAWKKYAFCLLASTAFAFILYFSASQIKTWLLADQYWMTGAIFNSYTDLSLTFVGIFAFALLYQIGSLRKIMNLLAPCGRMSLTLYITQSFVFVPVFYGFGLSAYSYLGQANSVMIGIACWVIQVIFAHYWFRNYYYGPLEWVWRAATYFNKDIRLKREKLYTAEV